MVLLRRKIVIRLGTKKEIKIIMKEKHSALNERKKIKG